MLQFYRFKRQHPDCVLLFRIGDFYETFDQDAVTLSKVLGLTLTRRTEGLPMAGVPYHQLEVYLRRAIAAGLRVAVADQLEDSAVAKGLVQRGVTRVVTPGTIVDESLLDEDASTTIAAVCFTGSGDDSLVALGVVEASTGDFTVSHVTPASAVDELVRRRARELLYADAGGPPPARVQKLLSLTGIPGTARPAWHFRLEEAAGEVRSHFAVKTLAGFGLGDEDPALTAAGALLRYLKETQTPEVAPGADGTMGALAPRATLAHLRPPRREEPAGSCVVDAVSLRALEVERVMRPGAAAGAAGAVDRSLVGIFLGSGSACVCKTAMGKRLLRDWLCRPLGTLAAIHARQSGVALFVGDRRVAGELAGALAGVQDIARIAARVSLDRATPRDVVALGASVARLPMILAPLANAPVLAEHAAELLALGGTLTPLAARIVESCVENPPPHMREGGLFKDGVDAALDEARLLQRDGGTWLAAYQERLARELELPGLKVGFNKVFGYYIELPAAQSKRAPAALERKQTLKNAERYTTPELREFERKVLTAESRGLDRERELLRELTDRLRQHLGELQRFAGTVAALDALLGLAERSVARGWTRPEVVQDPVLHIEGGRHPVLEDLLGTEFVPNDLTLGGGGGGADAGGSLAVITGPNMAGKSTFIRQVALIVLLAHAGSFVPATRATIGLCDRIFTRIGADDALHAGQSTFMVEMTETAAILNHATASSLVVLDEIGRGTSTYDGLSLAWAIAEHLALGAGRGGGASCGPRTLFATHYHELTDLEEQLPGRVRNLHVAVREWPSQSEPGHTEIVFLHRILPGRTDQSYGVHVARLAGLPREVIERAREVLASLDSTDGHAIVPHTTIAGRKAVLPPDGQLSLFTEFVAHPAVDQLRALKLESLNPMQAFDLLRRLKESVGD